MLIFPTPLAHVSFWDTEMGEGLILTVIIGPLLLAFQLWQDRTKK